MAPQTSMLLELVTTIGLSSSLVIFFVWVGWKREERLAGRVTQLETEMSETHRYVHAEMVELVKSNTKAVSVFSERIADLAEVMKATDTSMQSIASKLDARPRGEST